MSNRISNQEDNIETHGGKQRVFTQTKVIQTITRSIRTEISQASSTKISRHTRVSSWGFAGANISVELQPLNFTGVNRAGVISAWSLGAPDTFLAAISELQESGVLSFDHIDILPTHNGGADRIVNAHTLIENLNAGAMQNDVDNQGKESAPSNGAENRTQVTGQDALENHASKQYVGNDCSHHRSAGSEEFTIIHRSILSRKAEVLHV